MSVQALNNANQAARTNFVRHVSAAWQHSHFGWIRNHAAATRGVIGRTLIEALLVAAGYTGVKARGKALAVGKRVLRTKLSLEWDGTHEFKFQQIHRGRGTHLAMLGLRPNNDAYLWVCTEAQAIAISEEQHGPGSRWISFPSTQAPLSLTAHGGPVANSAVTLRAALGGPP
jgi:hypothetical protein